MIIIDVSSVLITHCIGLFDKVKNDEMPNDQVFKHFALEALLKYKNMFGKKYGDPVLCFDRPPYWRKKVFEHYKGNRKKDNSKVDWDLFMQMINEFREDCFEFLGWKCMYVKYSEADDCVFVLAKESIRSNQKSIIISEDKDLIQVQHEGMIQQYGPRKRKLLDKNNTDYDSFTHIVKAGDDGIPNVYSPEDTFMVEGLRQTVMSKKKLQTLIDNKDDLESFLDETAYKRYKMNELLIDANKIPEKIYNMILLEYNKETNPKQMKSMCVKYRLRNMLEKIGEF